MRNANSIAIIMTALVLNAMLHVSVVAQQFIQQGPKLFGSGATGIAQQGVSVALSSDGNTALIGGSRDNNFAGAAWVFTRAGSAWSQQGAKLVGTGRVGSSRQGVSVSLSSDGNTALVGGNDDNASAGAAWVFTRSGGTWTQQGPKLVGTGAVGSAEQGISVSLSADGNTAIIGGNSDNTNAGAAWVFTRNGGVWSQLGTKSVGTGAVGSPAVHQGNSVALSADANTALVGGFADNAFAGATWVFTRSNTYSYNFSKNNVNKAILDNQNTFDTLTVFTSAPLAGFVSDVNVTIDTIIHPNVSDLEISLLHLGVNDTIAYQVGGVGDNFIGTVLDDSATTPIANGTAPFTGRFRPTRPLTQFNTLDAGGSWVLRVFDRATGSTGTLRAWSLSIGVSATTFVSPISHEAPEGFRLQQNYPNPFNPSTRIRFSIASRRGGEGENGRTGEGARVTLMVYDVLGREVATLVNENLSAGSYEATFDARNIASGVYFYRLTSGGLSLSRKLLLTK